MVFDSEMDAQKALKLDHEICIKSRPLYISEFKSESSTATEFKFSTEEVSENKSQTISSDFRFQTGFRAHFVREEATSTKEAMETPSDASQKEVPQSGNQSDDQGVHDIGSNLGQPGSRDTPTSSIQDIQDSEDIWATESKVVLRKNLPVLREKKSDTGSTSGSASGSRHNLKGLADRRSGTDQEGWSSSTETSYFTAEQTSGTASGHSRPASSDMDPLLSAVSEISSSTSAGTHSYRTAHDGSTADSSLYFTAESANSSHSVQSSTL